MIELKAFAEKLSKEKSIALFCHVRPDGDTIGSALALKLALEKINIVVDVFCEDAIPERFFFLEQAGLIKNQITNNYTAFVGVDCADLSRLGVFAEEFEKHKNTYLIDHHISNTRFAKTSYVFDNASNSENIYELINLLNIEICDKIANLLAMGIMTDTGNFKHKNVTANTFKVMADVVSRGADVNVIAYNMFTKQSPNRAKLFGKTMANIRYFYDGRVAIATVMQSDVEFCNAKEDETEGFIDFVMGISGVEIGACVLQTETNKYKISLRSSGKSNVNNVALSFGGGGHILASGCRICGEYEDVIDRLCFAISRELID